MPRQECGCVLRIAENLPVVLGHIEVFDQFVGERFVVRGFHEQFKDMPWSGSIRPKGRIKQVSALT